MPTPVDREELHSAMDWVSIDGAFDSEAYVCRETGRVYQFSSEYPLEEEAPGDFADEDRFVPVPGRRDLGLSKHLALGFVEEHLPDDLDTASGYFRKPGAFGRFKNLLLRRGVLEQWYAYQAKAEADALEVWAKENGFELVSKTG